MTKAHATAEIFWTAFQALPRKEKDVVLRRILKDKKLRRDLPEVAIKRRRTARSHTTRKHLTARQLLNSGLIGMWQDRTDIGDSAVYARQLREQAQNRNHSK